ncbi:potassium voltage-gated channel subfamily A member 1-like [Branchiostoma lanceolatum]|uniref:potassium voltage-gated channel subfamily A member 1-like n=1 Tax=Branchiostoma lanceolatum TaxID=7740 RepID=UPI0034552BEC
MESAWILGAYTASGELATPRTQRRMLFGMVQRQQYRWREFDRDMTADRARAALAHLRRRVVINVAGLRFELEPETLARFPNTLLGSAENRKKFYDPYRDEYFFDRHRPSAEAIIAFYQTGGRLDRPDEVPVDVFTDEVRFFKLGDDVIQRYREKEGFHRAAEQPLPRSKLVKDLWVLATKPRSSPWAILFAFFSVFAILLSVAAVCAETLPMLKHSRNEKSPFTDTYFLIESVCTGWFVLELLLRVLTCPNRKRYFKSTLHIYDMIAVTPWFITIVAMMVDPMYMYSGWAMRVTRLLRATRALKLARYSRGLRMIGLALTASLPDIGMLGVFMGICIILFASAIFFIEFGYESTHFESIPDAFWWALITMVTVGYGDHYPTTGGGKFLGSICALAGILTIALPVPVIVTKFDELYDRQTEKDNEEDEEERKKDEDMEDSEDETLSEAPTTKETIV